jgi:hypothetical protein
MWHTGYKFKENLKKKNAGGALKCAPTQAIERAQVGGMVLPSVAFAAREVDDLGFVFEFGTELMPDGGTVRRSRLLV